MDYRIEVFSNGKSKSDYFDNIFDAVMFGQKQLGRISVFGVFLLKKNCIGKYDVVCAIK